MKKYNECYLVILQDENITDDIFNVLYGSCKNTEDEMLMSIPMLQTWIESDFTHPDAQYIEQSTCEYLSKLNDKLNTETGYIIFRNY